MSQQEQPEQEQKVSTIPMTVEVREQLYADVLMYFEAHHKRNPKCCDNFDHWCSKAIGRKLIVDQFKHWVITLGLSEAQKKAIELSKAYHCESNE